MIACELWHNVDTEERIGPRIVNLPPTQWSLVVAARDPSTVEGTDALERLCCLYYYPLYAFVRQRGYGPDDAQDLIQGFFCRVLDKNYFSQADGSRGRFRTFLLAALRHFLANEWNRDHALKRGGEHSFISLDGLEPEARYSLEPADSMTPDQMYDRAWAITIVKRAKANLRNVFVEKGQEARFALLEGCMLGESTPGGYEAIAERLATTETAVRSEVQRLRRRFRQVLRTEILETMESPGEVDEELRVLVSALRGSAV